MSDLNSGDFAGDISESIVTENGITYYQYDIELYDDYLYLLSVLPRGTFIYTRVLGFVSLYGCERPVKLKPEEINRPQWRSVGAREVKGRQDYLSASESNRIQRDIERSFRLQDVMLYQVLIPE